MTIQTGSASTTKAATGLAGKRVVVTRAAHQAGAFEDLLRNHGAVPLVYPCLSIQPVEDLSLLDAALRKAMSGHYDWLIFTSVNTVSMVAARLMILNPGFMKFNLRIAAVGTKTAQAVESWFGVKAHIVSEDYRSQGLAAGLDLHSGMRVLLPQAEIAPRTLKDTLHDRGAEVDRIAVYKTVSGGGGGVDLASLIRWNAIDVITFASPSAVRGFVTRMLNEAGHLPDFTHLTIGVIGPTTKQAALDVGLPVEVMPNVYTLEELVNALEQYFASH
jgi:uroporphyrinogen-III synthase